MAITAGTLALIGAGLAAAGATGGAIGSASNRRKAREEESRAYQNARDYLNSQYYRDPLTTAGNRSLLKLAEKNYSDNLDAIQNRMAAGGATMENQLAARQANNESRDKLYSQLLIGEDARRDRIGAQRLSLDQQHSQNLQSGYYQAAQDWQSWGAAMGQAGMSLMSSGLLGDMGGAAGAAGGMTNAQRAEAMGVAAKGLVRGDMMQPITGGGVANTPGVTAPKLGLAGR